MRCLSLLLVYTILAHSNDIVVNNNFSNLLPNENNKQLPTICKIMFRRPAPPKHFVIWPSKWPRPTKYDYQFLRDNLDTAETVNVLLVGDSVDRFAVADYCGHRSGVLCSPLDNLKLDRFNLATDECNVISKFNTNLALPTLFAGNDSVRNTALVCFLPQERTVVGFIFNRYGVNPCIMCHRDDDDILGLENYRDCHAHSMKTFLEVSLVPTMMRFKKLMKSNIIGLFLHSTLWDLSFDFKCNKFNESDRDPFLFVNQWKQKLSTFIEEMRASVRRLELSDNNYFSKTSLIINSSSIVIGLRSANVPMNFRSKKKEDSVKIQWINSMNKAGKEYANQSNLVFVDYNHFSKANICRDGVHPNHDTSALLMETMLYLVQRRIMASTLSLCRENDINSANSISS